MKNQLWNIDLILEDFPDLFKTKKSFFELICYLNGKQYATNLEVDRSELVQEIMEMINNVQKEWSSVLELNYKRDKKVYHRWRKSLEREGSAKYDYFTISNQP